MAGKLKQTGGLQPLLTQEEIADLLAPMEHESGGVVGHAQGDESAITGDIDEDSLANEEMATGIQKKTTRIRVEVGRASIADEDFPEIKKGAIVPLERHIDEPLDLYVNNRLVARGGIVRLGGKMGFKVTEMCLMKTPGEPE